ncbi:hypothetical protein [Flavobacterium johnsoniae]|jgi:hypothetical protein|uniref:Uncharacterized protein n=2 Tax=Flavobacterium johnsoniae TaxID=986 RepID=A0A1M5H2N0_FLAJO|nr:hypothetical protein [Flavobacterium johnsoniae]ABQ04306.1 hypothetical protein Fjoh_1274 [Flavobacterium johnsoniae UW101]OXG02467.1 hypothetical protein B0A63_02080 [Flavobacterium johnsoniae UW101]WQG83901.1 hypothetical protein SR927_12415 [Flavobacterium johnsoniae UW101]SHG10269.1 hypothetical protein SAMN05444388_101676 [Flavobacterium johnsoniae]SHK18461.1 hypothetical protein SAMN05444146_0695 [Flavobacterium johnsoniae]
METYQFTDEKTLDKFYKMISAKTRNGFVIVEHNEKLPYVVLSKEKKAVKHTFHLLLTCLTFGLWSVVWIYLIITLSRKQSILVAVDEDGNLFEDKCLSA